MPRNIFCLIHSVLLFSVTLFIYPFPVFGEEVSSRQQLLKEMEKNYPALKAAKIQIKAAEAQILQAEIYPYNPVLELGGEADGPDIKMGENRFEALISQEIEWWKPRNIRINIAKSQLEETRRDYENQVRLMTQKLLKTFEAYLYQKEKVRLGEEVLSLQEKLLQAATGRLENGDIPELDVNLAKVEVEKAKHQINSFRADLTNLQREINALAGRPLEDSLVTGDQLKKTIFPESLSSLLEASDKNRPDLQSLEKAEQTARLRTEEEKGKRIPHLTGTLGVVREQLRLGASSVSAPESTSLLVGKLSVPLPLINRNQGAIGQSLIQENYQASRTEELRYSIHLEVISYYQKLQNYGMNLDHFEKTILSLSKDNLNRLQEAFQEGQLGTAAVLIQEDRYIQTQSAYLETLYNYNLALIDLKNSAGLLTSVKE